MEMLLAVTIFIIIVLSATRIFQLVVQGQRQAIAAYHVQENLKYFFEVMSKEVRMAKMDTAGECYPISVTDELYYEEDSELYFKNYEDECVHYYLDTVDGVTRFKIDRGVNSGYITTSNININNLNFVINSGATEQPSITVSLKAEALGKEADKAEMVLQTTIASRYYK